MSKKQDLIIHIRLALSSLGLRPVVPTRWSTDRLEKLLAELRKWQTERGIIKKANEC